MRVIYSLSIYIYHGLLRILSHIHPKAKLFVEGRKTLFQDIKSKVDPSDCPIWFHFASLGEFEQGRSVLEAVKSKYPLKKILITFYSPSGYEIRKNTDLADYVFYLPVDTGPNARYFIDLVNPSLVIFTKYEYWFHFFNELDKRDIPLLMISAIYRPDQVFFKPWGRFFIQTLKKVNYFFVQNAESLDLLKRIGLKNASIAGDTRFDRVNELARHPVVVSHIEEFLQGSPCLVAGSTWKADEELLSQIYTSLDMKMIIAPHEVFADHIQEIQQLFPDHVLYSKLKDNKSSQHSAQVLIIDGIGILSYLYRYARVTYIGGGFGTGIHNTLEAATYGKPIIFGPNYYKFQEAKDLIEKGAAFSIKNVEELRTVLSALENKEKLDFASREAASYVKSNSGATDVILKYIEMNRWLD